MPALNFQHVDTAVQAVEAQPVTEKVMPGHDRSAELKLYSLSPHVMDQYDDALTSLSSSIGKPCSKVCFTAIPQNIFT